MITWHMGIKSQMVVNKKTDDQTDYLSEWYKGDEQGTQENNIMFTTHKDGSMFISDVDREGITYLYPEQVAHLRDILRNMEAR